MPMNTTAASRYVQLETARFPFLKRARDAARLTIPTLVPPEGAGSHTEYYVPYQGLAARGVNNLASKLLLTLFPPNAACFRLQIDEITLDKLTGNPGMKTEVDKGLAKVERAVTTEIETTAVRVSAFEGLKQLIVAGSVLLYMAPEGGMRVFRLDRHVVHRDPMGNVLEIITKEDIAETALPASLQTTAPEGGDKTVDKIHCLYTRVQRTQQEWTIYQEVKGQVVPGSKGTYPLDKSPWLPLRWAKIDGEDYGRGHVEEYLGDVRSLENLTKAIVQGSVAASKVVFLVAPNGQTKLEVVSQTENGDVRAGKADDISVIQCEKMADFQIAFKTIEMITQRLSFAFMLNSSVQRSGDRVTAEEIRYMAGELEDSLGGVYSILSQELQLPMIVCLMARMERQKRLPPLPKDIIKPMITTGLEALGRGHDLAKLQQFISILTPLAQQAQGLAALGIKMPGLVTELATSMSIETDGFMMAEDEMAQAQQQQQQAETASQMMDKLGPKAMDIAHQQMQQQGANGAPQVQPGPPQGR